MAYVKMEHTVQAYTERRTPAELLRFLQMCMLQNQWEQYPDIIPIILTSLQKRNVAVPEQIQSSWEQYLQTD